MGNTHLFVTPISYPFPTAETARWSATNDYQPNGVRSKLLYAEYMVSVYGAMASNYSIIAIVNGEWRGVCVYVVCERIFCLVR